MNAIRMPSIVTALLLFTGTSVTVHGQGIAVDEGRFRVLVDGREVGSEEFVVRRAGPSGDNALFANGTIVLNQDGVRQEIRPLLNATPPDGTAEAYQVRVTGHEPMEIRLNRAGRRYVARISSGLGDEDREFPARPDTRIVELDVAHHYYFLRDLRPGRSAPILEPRGRRQTEVTAESASDEELQLGRNFVQTRKVEFAFGEERRSVWYDGQGRVVRVEIPARGYVAERADLVG